MDFRQIFRNDKLLSFWPSSRQTAEDRTYSTIRFILYATVIIYIIKRDARIFALAALVLGILYLLRRAGMIQEGRAFAAVNDGRAMRMKLSFCATRI